MKKKIILITILAGMSQSLSAGDREDLKYVYMLFQNKEYSLSIDELERFVTRYPSSDYYDTAQNLLAQSYYNVKDYNNAEKRYKILLNSDFRDEAAYYLAFIAIERENYDKAEKYIASISVGSKYRDAVLYKMAAVYYTKGMTDEAIDYFNKIRREKGSYEKHALFNLGLIYYNKKDYFRSAVFLEEYLGKEKNDFEKMSAANYMLAFSNYQVEDYPRAIKYYSVVEDEFYASDYYERALRDKLFIYISKDDEKNIDKYASALEGTGFEEDALQNTGNYYYKKENFARAEGYYLKLIEKYANVDAMYLLGRVQLNLNKKEEALFNFKKLKDSEKYVKEYYYYTAYLLYEDKKYNDVLRLLKNADKLDINKELKEQLYVFSAESAFILKEYEVAKKYFELIYNSSKTIENLYKLIVVSGKLKDEITVEELYNVYNKNYEKDREYRKDIYLITANLMVEKGELGKGEKIYKDFLLKQEDEAVTENLVTVLTRQGKYDELVEFLDKLDPNPENVYLKGLSFLGLSNFEEAEKIFSYLINSDSEKIDKNLREKATVKMIESTLASKNYKKTLEFINIYEKNEYTLTSETVEQSKALAYFRLGSYKNARAVYKKYLEDEDKKEFAKYMIAESYYNEKNYKKARESYIDLYRTAKNRQYAKEAAYWLIRVENFEGNYGKLEERVKGFRTEFPNSEYEEDITYIMANVYIINSEKSKAIEEYSKLYEGSSKESIKEQSAQILTELYYKDGNSSKALEWNEKVKDTGYKNLWFGIIYEGAGKIPEAIAYYKKAEKDKNYGDLVNFNLGEIYLEQKNYTLARETFEKVTEYEASSVRDKAQYNIGITYEAEENYTRAINSFMRVKLLYTESTIQDLALIKIAENYEKSGDTKKAIEAYREFFDTYKNSEDYQYVVEKLLVYHINSNNLDIAKSYYEELKRLDMEHAKQYTEYLGG
jgi:tetratricopeptide (TPR) repeat protein